MEKEELLPQLSEEQIEAEEQRRLKEKMEKEQKKKSKQPESESSNQDSTGSLFSKLKDFVMGDDKTKEEDTTDMVDIETKEEKEDENPFSNMFNRMKPEKYVAPTPQIRIDAKPDKDTTIHVMSVASGHLYERFLKV